MLTALELRNFAIVDSLRIELSAGLNVLTGETGAGKSVLIDALSLLIGSRADSSWIRSGTESALIQGLFKAEAGLESAARRLVLNGRSTARVDGELISITELSERLGALVAIHGQHASQALMTGIEQRKILDRLLDTKAQTILIDYRKDYARLQQISKDLDDLRAQVRERARRMDILQFQIEEIEAAKLNTDELEHLQAELESLRYAERITQNTGRALQALSEGDVNAVQLLADAGRDLDSAGRYSKDLASLGSELRDALASVEAISNEVARFLSDFEADPSKLERLENRMILIESLQRKYGESIQVILEYRDKASAELEQLAHAEENAEALEQEQTALLKNLEHLATHLRQARDSAGKKLAKAVTKELQPLGMAKAMFEVIIRVTEAFTAYGKDTVNFLFSANLGEKPAALADVASGGELSRVMLALNVVTGSDLPILAFDEVDAGIGGKTARAVGALLKQLAKDHQVLVVTHLPQVAAFADTQFYVEKQEVAGRTVTRVRRLEPHERELELARMLSGSVTDASVANARELLAEATA